MKTTLSALALCAVLIGGAAQAADLPSKKAPPPAFVPPPPVFTWTGFYAGLNLGGGWSNGRTRWFNNGGGSGFVIGGGQVGVNYQLAPMFVAGLETDFQGASSRLHWLGTVRGRLGVTPFNPNLLFYGTGGFAYGEVGQGFIDPITGLWRGNSQTKTGWTAGGGVEWKFLPNWSAKIEYLYTDISGSDGGFFARPSRHAHPQVVRAGLNYHFNFGGPQALFQR